MATIGIGAANRMLTGALFCFSLTGSAGGKMLSYIARASRIRRARSRSDFGTNRIIRPYSLQTLVRQGIRS